MNGPRICADCGDEVLYLTSTDQCDACAAETKED